MTGPGQGEVARLFELAVAADPGERAAVLDACGDPALRREVESLLAADEQAAGFLDLPEPGAEPSGARIGPYRLVRALGEGEVSTVHLAVRDDEAYHQRVAIKLIRPGMDSRQILQRFRQERQILASLSHPNIARLLDGGSTPAGQPYFVMEYVDGEPLDVHCEQRQLPVVRRLELFGRVCQAVHFAHTNLVVHRDLKPSNILVDADGAPKLLDFGIAKLIRPEPGLEPGVEPGPELAEVRAGVPIEPTATVARLMTPHYASPEQVQGRPVSTASDVYSLGVILYKLLTGRRPYELASLSLADIERVVCEAAPPPPSQIARGRLPRDLDNIVRMAMRKEPERRYASAQALADDVRRCLEHRPVVARRETLGYRASSFVRRNTGAVAAAAVIGLSLLGGAIATTWQWRQAVAERTRAETQRRTAEQTLDFVVEMFRPSDPRVPASEVNARQMLGGAIAQLDGPLQQSPALRAALQHTLGVVSSNLGDYEHAATLLEAAVAARGQIPGGELDLADSLTQLASFDGPKGKPYTSVSLLQRALAIRVQQLGPDDPAVADTLERLAFRVGYDFEEAERDYQRALAIRRRLVGDDDPRLLPAVVGLAELYSTTGRFAEADARIHQALAIRERATSGDPCDAGGYDFLEVFGTLLYSEGYYDGAARYTDAALDCMERTFGADHVAIADHAGLRIMILRAQGKYAEAEALARRGLIERTAGHGADSAAVDNALDHLARVLHDRGKLDEAMQCETQSLAMRERTYGRLHDSVAASLLGIGNIQLAAGDALSAEASYGEARDIWRKTLGVDHPRIAEATLGIAEALVAQRRFAEARPEAKQALAHQQQHLRPGHPAMAATLEVLGASIQAESPAAAEPLFSDALAILRAELPPDHPDIAVAESLLGACLALQHRADAQRLLDHAAQVLHAKLGDDHFATRRAEQRRQAAAASAATAVPRPADSAPSVCGQSVCNPVDR